MYFIPVARAVPHQTQTTTLDGRSYRISLDWNQRIQRWTVSLATAAGVDVMTGKGLALGADILRQVRYRPDAPQGTLTVVDMAPGAAQTEPTLDSLGTRHRIVYV